MKNNKSIKSLLSYALIALLIFCLMPVVAAAEIDQDEEEVFVEVTDYAPSADEDAEDEAADIDLDDAYNDAQENYEDAKNSAKEAIKTYNELKSAFLALLADYEAAVENYNTKLADLQEDIEAYEAGLAEFNEDVALYGEKMAEYAIPKAIYDDAFIKYEALRNSDAPYQKIKAGYDDLVALKEELQLEELRKEINDMIEALLRRKTELDFTAQAIEAELAAYAAIIEGLYESLEDAFNDIDSEYGVDAGLKTAYANAAASYQAAKDAYKDLAAVFAQISVEYAKELAEWKKWVKAGGRDEWSDFKDYFDALDEEDPFKVAVLALLGDSYTDKELYEAALAVSAEFDLQRAAINAANEASEAFYGYLENAANDMLGFDGSDWTIFFAELTSLFDDLYEAMAAYDNLFKTTLAAAFKADYDDFISALEDAIANGGLQDLIDGHEFLKGNGERRPDEEKDEIKLNNANYSEKRTVNGKVYKYGYPFMATEKQLVQETDKDGNLKYNKDGSPKMKVVKVPAERVFPIYMLDVSDKNVKDGKVLVPVYKNWSYEEDGGEILGYVYGEEKSNGKKTDKNGKVSYSEKINVLTFFAPDQTTVIGVLTPYKDETDPVGKSKATLVVNDGFNITMLYCTEGSDMHIATFGPGEFDLYFHYHGDATGITFAASGNSYPGFGGGIELDKPDSIDIAQYLDKPDWLKAYLIGKFRLCNPQELTIEAFEAWLRLEYPDFTAEQLAALEITEPDLPPPPPEVEEPTKGGGGGGGRDPKDKAPVVEEKTEIAIIAEPEVPISLFPDAVLPEPEEIEEIIPLGNLPQTGFNDNLMAAMIGLLIALLGITATSVTLLIKKEKA